MAVTDYNTDLFFIGHQASLKEEENEYFLQFIKHFDSHDLDAMAHAINDEVSAAIDCTKCGNCCKTLVINVTPIEIESFAAYLDISVFETKEKYIEESLNGACYINSMPCHFLSDKKCTIYTQRFTECRDFPHLHKDGFKERLLGTLLHYGGCPIVYNVIEEMKKELHFIE